MRWWEFSLFLLILWSIGARADLDLNPQWNMALPDRRKLVPPPKPRRLNLNERIFDDHLVSEFRDRYEERFGPIELAYLSPDLPEIETVQIKSLNLTERETIVEESDALEDYGSFVVRRLVEYHVDYGLKENHEARPVYNAKERITNASLSMGTKYRVRSRYSISGNYLENRLINPYVDFRVVIDLGPGARFNREDIIYSLRKELGRGYRFDAYFRENEQLLFVGLRKKISENLVATFRTSTYFPRPEKEDEKHSNLVLAGLSYRY